MPLFLIHLLASYFSSDMLLIPRLLINGCYNSPLQRPKLFQQRLRKTKPVPSFNGHTSNSQALRNKNFLRLLVIANRHPISVPHLKAPRPWPSPRIFFALKPKKISFEKKSLSISTRTFETENFCPEVCCGYNKFHMHFLMQKQHAVSVQNNYKGDCSWQ